MSINTPNRVLQNAGNNDRCPKAMMGLITNEFAFWLERHNTYNPEPRAMKLNESVITAEIEVCLFAHSSSKQTFSEHLVCARL